MPSEEQETPILKSEARDSSPAAAATVSIEERWDQATNCKDKSDEVDFRLLELEKNYNKKFLPSPAIRVIPLSLSR